MADEVEYTTGERRKMAVEWERFFGTDWPEHLNRQEAQDRETQEHLSRLAATTEQLGAEVDSHGEMLESIQTRLDAGVEYMGETRTAVNEISQTVGRIEEWVRPKMESEKARGIILRDWKAFVERMKPIVRAIMWLISGATAALIYLKTGHWPDGG